MIDPPEPSEESAEAQRARWILDSARGDETAFAQLYDHTVSVVYGLVLRILRSRELAAETVQEVYLMAWQQADRFDPGRGTTQSWLCTIAHRCAVEKVRAVSRYRSREDRYGADLGSSEPHDLTWEDVERTLDRTDVQSGLAELSELQREALILVYFRGMSHRELAEALRIPLGTAKSRIRDGLTNLRTVLGE